MYFTFISFFFIWVSIVWSTFRGFLPHFYYFLIIMYYHLLLFSLPYFTFYIRFKFVSFFFLPFSSFILYCFASLPIRALFILPRSLFLLYPSFIVQLCSSSLFVSFSAPLFSSRSHHYLYLCFSSFFCTLRSFALISLAFDSLCRYRITKLACRQRILRFRWLIIFYPSLFLS